jgi:hypothetical protein
MLVSRLCGLRPGGSAIVAQRHEAVSTERHGFVDVGVRQVAFKANYDVTINVLEGGCVVEELWKTGGSAAQTE